MDNILIEQATVAAEFIKQFFKTPLPNSLVILGSGLGNFTQIVEVIESISYANIPHFPQSHVMGHKGNLSIAKLKDGSYVLLMEGRFHYYEGYSPQQIGFPMVVFHLLGIKNLIVSNAAGAINQSFQVGDLVLITDHINFTGNNPLIGKNNNDNGPRFVDLTNPYSSKLINLALESAAHLNMTLQQGTYIGVSGPTYETCAEIKAFRILGGDVVGMSTIYEVIMANYLQIQVLGISCVTNMATGISNAQHSHSEIINCGIAVSEKFSRLIENTLLLLNKLQ
jgi:purine-nucleoside phosphorylase